MNGDKPRATKPGVDLDSGALLASLIENSADAIVAKSIDGTVLSWNPAAEQIFGYSAEEMVGQSIRTIIPEQSQGEEDEILARIMAGQKIASKVVTRLRKDGSEVRLSITVSPIRDANGTIIGASKIARDVGEISRAREALAASESRFRMMADNIAQLAWIADEKGSIFWYNKRWLDYTGRSLQSMKGWGWKKVHHPDHVDRVVEKISSCFETGDAWEDTFPLRGADGTYRWFLSRARPIRNEDGSIQCWFGTNTDVTRQREQARAIRSLLDEVNHRTRNLLTVVMTLARRSAPGNQNFAKRFIRRIEALMVNQDLLVENNWSTVGLEELVATQLRYVADKVGTRLAYSGPDIALSARAAEILGMALHELATNALKFGALSQPDGEVAISWKADDDLLRLDWREVGGPAIGEPDRSGFGTSVIRDIPAAALKADVRLEFRPSGVRWSFLAPISRVAAGE